MSEVRWYDSERDIMEMDKAGNYYCRHVSAMTREALHSKSEIAAELGWRDMHIDQLKAENERIKEEIRRWVIRLQQRGLEMDELSNECYQLTAERDTLRKQLYEARELLRYAANECIPSLGREIEAWLEAHK